jgi:Fe-S cluster assembly iron-binding protein IscA
MQEIYSFTSYYRKSMENNQGIILTPEAAIAVKTLLKDQEQVIVDAQTLAYLGNANVKFVEENGRKGFQIEPLTQNNEMPGCAGCDPTTGCG